MTNQDINNAAEAFFEKRRQSQGGSMDWLGVSLLAEHMRTLASRAYEEAAKLACPMCADGYEPLCVEGESRYIHPDIAACSAGKIHALKDQLQTAAVV